MEVIPQFAIGSVEGKVVDCNRYGYRFICRLSIPTSRRKSTVKWLQKNKAQIIYTKHTNIFFIAIFITDNAKLVYFIDKKYKASKVSTKVLYQKIDTQKGFNPFKKDCLDSRSTHSDRDSGYYDYNDEYDDRNDENYNRIMRDMIYESEEYSRSMVESEDSGWFYSDSDYSAYEECLSSLAREEWY